MPTSSIFADFTIRDKETAERFVKAIEESSKLPFVPNPNLDVKWVKDREEIRGIFSKKLILIDKTI